MNILRKILLLPPLVNCGLGIGLIVGLIFLKFLAITIPALYASFSVGLLD
jgi:hypothetical protein